MDNLVIEDSEDNLVNIDVGDILVILAHKGILVISCIRE